MFDATKPLEIDKNKSKKGLRYQNHWLYSSSYMYMYQNVELNDILPFTTKKRYQVEHNLHISEYSEMTKVVQASHTFRHTIFGLQKCKCLSVVTCKNTHITRTFSLVSPFYHS